MRGPPSRRGRALFSLTADTQTVPLALGTTGGISSGAVVCRSVVSPGRSRFAGLRYMRRWADPENSPRRLCGVARSLVAHHRRLCRVLDALGSPALFHHYQRRRRSGGRSRESGRAAGCIGLLPGGQTAADDHHRGDNQPSAETASSESTTDTTAASRHGPTGDRTTDHHGCADDHSSAGDNGPVHHNGPAHHQCSDDHPQRRASTVVALVRGGDEGLGNRLLHRRRC